MKPTSFPEQTLVLAKDQPEYKELPVNISKSPKGEVVSCWKLSFTERIILLFTGRVWLQMLMFRDQNGKLNPVTPSYLTVNKTEVLP